MARARRAAVPLLRLAFLHPLNVLFLASQAATALLTGSWVPLAVGLGTEAIWGAFALRNQKMRRRLVQHHLRRQNEVAGDQRYEQLSALSDEDRRRYLELERLKEDVHQVTRENPSLAGELLVEELGKLDHLVSAFLKTAADAARYRNYLEESSLEAVEQELSRQSRVVEETTDPQARKLAEQGLDLLRRRIEKTQALHNKVRASVLTLNMLENTIRLLRDQVVNMESTEELATHMRSLMQSVDAIVASAQETEAVGQPLRGLEAARN